jgi:hypothetical protein
MMAPILNNTPPATTQPDAGTSTNLRTLGATDVGTSSTDAAATALSGSLSKTLSGALGDLGSGPDTKSILDTYAARKTNAQTLGESERALTTNKYAGLIEDTASSLGQSLNLEAEARKGFATNTALVKQLTDTGSKRIRELARDRDSLLLQQKYQEAGQMDGLIAEEQSTITNARKDWLASFLQLGAESRAQASFETPDVKRSKDFTYNQKEADANALRSLATLAPDAAIVATDTYDEAVAKYRASHTYSLNQQTAEAQLAQIHAQTAASYESIAKSKADRALTTFDAGTGLSGDNASLNDAFNNALPYVDTKFQSDEAKRQFKSYLANGQTEKAKDYLKSMVKSSVDQPTRDKLNAGEGAISALTDLQSSLQAYKDKGGDTNILKGTLESVAQKAGQTTDPELAKIGNKIAIDIQQYRKAISGAAFTEAESKEYASIFPSFFSSAELNDAKISSALDAIQGNQSSIYRGVFQSSYDPVFGGATNAPKAPAGSGGFSGAAPAVVAPGNLFSGLFGG